MRHFAREKSLAGYFQVQGRSEIKHAAAHMGFQLHLYEKQFHPGIFKRKFLEVAQSNDGLWRGQVQ